MLDILLEERKVVSAARRLSMTQPSASAALERCRRLFGDPLLVRSGRGMALTARAEALREPVRAMIGEARMLLGSGPAEVGASTRTVRMIASDVPAVTLVPMLWERLRSSAPGIDLVLLPWRDADDVISAFTRDQADLAISVLPQAGTSFRRTELYIERYCIAMRRGHPAAAAFDIEQWLAYPHVIVSSRGAQRTPLDDLLELQGRARRVGVVVPNFMMVPPLLLAADLIAMLPHYCMRSEPGLDYRDPPLPVEGFPLHLAIAKRAVGDVAVQHVAALIREFFPSGGADAMPGR